MGFDQQLIKITKSLSNCHYYSTTAAKPLHTHPDVLKWCIMIIIYLHFTQLSKYAVGSQHVNLFGNISRQKISKCLAYISSFPPKNDWKL